MTAFRRLPPRTRRSVLHRLGRFAPWEEGFDFTPPPLAAGESVGPPDFVGIGAQKAGTTWWYGLIVSHPGVYSRPDVHKERHFLSRFADSEFGASEQATYHAWFPRVAGKLAGEWTPDYLAYPWVPALLQAAAPDTRLLVILRDPVERFCSGLAHMWRNGSPRSAETTWQAVSFGLYNQALDFWFGHFDDERFLFLQYEACRRDPETQLAATYRFLGLDDSYHPPHIRQTVSSSGEDSFVPDEELRKRLVDVYLPDVTALGVRLPGLDLSLWPNFASEATQ